MTRNPKKIRQRLNWGSHRLDELGYHQLSKRQQHKITLFALSVANDSPAPWLAKRGRFAPPRNVLTSFQEYLLHRQLKPL